MFTDRVKITIKAGNGGNGAATFHREKYVPNGGPDGGDGGKGGDIVFETDPAAGSLIGFHYKRKFTADSGENGRGRNQNGKSASDLIIKVPAGTLIKDFETGNLIADMYYPGERKVILKGGRGGKGNAKFATPTRQAPTFAQSGEVTTVRTVVLELKTIADIGLVGLPNAGKSTLLSVLTGARPKIADYHFTTLSPNLGVAKHYDNRFVIADIPGLIEGAANGAGLGHNFLRHIERTRLIIHVVDMSGIEGDPYENYVAINRELCGYSEKLAEKPQLLALNKCDCVDAEENVRIFLSKLSKGTEYCKISARNKTGLNALLTKAGEMLATIRQAEPFETQGFAYSEQNVTEYSVKKTEDFYEIVGPLAAHLGRSVDLDDRDSFDYFQRTLRDLGVIDALRTAGIQDGDTVLIGEIDFEFVD